MFFSEKKETFFSESDLSILFKKISQNFAQWMSQKQIFKNIKGSRFGLGRFGLILKIQTQVRQVQGSIFQRFGGSRFGIFRFDPRLVWSLGYLVKSFMLRIQVFFQILGSGYFLTKQYLPTKSTKYFVRIQTNKLVTQNDSGQARTIS